WTSTNSALTSSNHYSTPWVSRRGRCSRISQSGSKRSRGRRAARSPEFSQLAPLEVARSPAVEVLLRQVEGFGEPVIIHRRAEACDRVTHAIFSAQHRRQGVPNQPLIPVYGS